MLQRVISKLWLPLVLLAAWELAARNGWIDAIFFPPPSGILQYAVRMARDGELGSQIGATFMRLGAGFLGGAVLGIVCGVVWGIAPTLLRPAEGLLAALYSTPKLTLLPLFLLVLGSGDLARTVVIGLGTFLLLVMQTIDAIKAVPAGYVETARNYGASGWTLVRRVYWPAGLPRLLTALRIAIGRATVLTISTEIIGAQNGIGHQIWIGWQTLATERIYMGIALSALLGSALIEGIRLLERRIVRWGGAAAMLLLACISLPAQTTGILEGRVLDTTGGGMADVAIRVEAVDTGLSRKGTTDGSGMYRLAGLGPGRYLATASKAGFQTVTRDGIAIGAGQALWVELRLQVDTVQEAITVSARPPLLNTNASDWGGGQEQRKLESMPLNGRDLFSLATQQTGANVNGTQASSLVTGTGVAISVNGARANQNSFRLDGMYINDATHSMPGSASGRLLGLESMQELRLVTSPFSAEYGQTAGGVLAAVSKSGTNVLHGSAYEFLRNDALDARNFFDQASPPPLRRHQLGGMINGPLRKDRLFYMANYERLHDTTSTTVRTPTLTAGARDGVLPGNAPINVPVGVRPFLAAYPLPNGREFGDGTAEFVAQRTRMTRENYATGKLDWAPSDSIRVGGRYTFDRASASVPEDFGLWSVDNRSQFHFLSSETQWIVSPVTLLTTRIGMSRILNGEYTEPLTAAARELSFMPGQGLGALRVTGLGDMGVTSVRQRPRSNALTDWQVQQDGTHRAGRHTLRAGAGFDLVRFDQRSDFSKSGYYQFTSVASLLQGRPQNGEAMPPEIDTGRRWRQFMYSGYAQDEFRVGPRFSLTLGVRWEATSVPDELDGKVATIRNPFADAKITVGGPLYKNPSWDNFAPRAALAWDPFGRGRTVIRAGFGVFFDLLGTKEIVIAGARVPPFYSRLTVANPGFPDLAASLASAAADQSVDMVDYAVSQPYTLQHQFELQHEAGAGLLLRAGYAGSRGVHLLGHLAEFNIRQPIQQADGRLFFPATGPRVNPNFGTVSTRRTQFNSFYHAFHAAVERRFGRWFGGQMKYTLAKSIDENSTSSFSEFASQRNLPTVLSYRSNRGRSNYDLRHAIAGNVTAATRRFTGWELHTIVTLQSGFPFTPTVGFDRAQLGAANDLSQRPDFAGGRVINGTADMWFDPQAFSLPAAGYLGNLGRNNFSGPKLATVDAAVHKTLWHREGHAVTLRIEAFNIANRSNLQIPANLALFNNRGQRVGSAGRIAATSTPARQIQMALRWRF